MTSNNKGKRVFGWKLGGNTGRVTARQGRVPEPSALFTIACASLTIASRWALSLEALRVDLVDVLRAGGPGREPAVRGHDFQSADRRVVARARGSAWR